MTTPQTKSPPKGKGVRHLPLSEQAPNCEILINRPLYTLAEIVKNSKVVDIGCGYGHNRSIIEQAGGEWVGVEAFEGGAQTVIASAEDLPFEDNSFDIAIMDAVLEHIPDVGKAFAEVGRVLRPGGKFIGYVAFMECFHEISYSHLSFKALEHYASINGMKLTRISGGASFGIDYHLSVCLYPIPTALLRKLVAASMRALFKLKSRISYLGLRRKRKLPRAEAKALAQLYYQVECLRQSHGFSYVIEKQ